MRKLAAACLVCLTALAYGAASKTAVLNVPNMTCPICPITLRKALTETPGVIGVSVDYTHKTVTVNYDSDRTNPTLLMKATANAGFPSSLQKKEQKR